MSTSNQDIKSVFDQAFAVEEIPFDMGAWNQMNALLNKRAKRRAIWIWFSGLALFIALTSTFVLSNSQDKTYRARTANAQFEPELKSMMCTEDIHSKNSKTQIAETTDAKLEPTNASNAMAYSEPAQVSLPISQLNSNHTPSKAEVSSPPTASANEPTMNNTGIVANSAIIEDLNPIVLANNDSMPRRNQTVSQREQEWLSLMGLLDLQSNRSDTSLSHRTASPLEKTNKKQLYNFYARAGVSKTIFHNPVWSHPELGQELGVGVQYLLREHLLLSSEVGFSRVRTEDTAQIQGPMTYGYTVNQNNYTINTSELYYLQLPVIAHYRMNRLMIGGGVSAGYLLGLKNETTHQVSSDRASITHANKSGIYRWDRYRNYQINALFDTQYQLASGSFIGARANYGLLNVLATKQKTIGISRIDIYLKLILK